MSGSLDPFGFFPRLRDCRAVCPRNPQDRDRDLEGPRGQMLTFVAFLFLSLKKRCLLRTCGLLWDGAGLREGALTWMSLEVLPWRRRGGEGGYLCKSL